MSVLIATAHSEGSGKSAHLRRLNLAIAACRCNKDHSHARDDMYLVTTYIPVVSRLKLYKFDGLLVTAYQLPLGWGVVDPRHEISNNVVCATSKASDKPAHMPILIRAFAHRLNILWLLSY